MCTQITLAGQLSTTARTDVDGRARPSRWMLCFHKATGRRLRPTAPPSGPGTETLTIAPATAQRLLAHLTELIRDEPRARR